MTEKRLKGPEKMAKSAAKIIGRISAFQPVDGEWLPLDALLSELWDTGQAKKHLRELLGVLERFPEEDGEGVLWSIVHGLEDIPGYESAVVESVLRQPSELAVTTIGRMLNSGTSQVGDASLFDVLRGVASAESAPESVKASAASWLRKHDTSGE
ncbi:MAG: hypothetical protein ACRC8S_06015 [Fimbriiglobus sp.]